MAAAETPEKKWYYGNCHCAAIKFKAHVPSLDEHEVKTCNCSICTRNGYLHVYVPREDVVFLKGEETAKGYYFSERRAEHRFCPNCGSSFAVDPHGNFGSPDCIAINVRMFQDVDLDKLKVGSFDGNKLPPAYNPE